VSKHSISGLTPQSRKMVPIWRIILVVLIATAPLNCMVQTSSVASSGLSACTCSVRRSAVIMLVPGAGMEGSSSLWRQPQPGPVVRLRISSLFFWRMRL